jgi:hypothetical protein
MSGRSGSIVIVSILNQDKVSGEILFFFFIILSHCHHRACGRTLCGSKVRVRAQAHQFHNFLESAWGQWEALPQDTCV